MQEVQSGWKSSGRVYRMKPATNIFGGGKRAAHTSCHSAHLLLSCIGHPPPPFCHLCLPCHHRRWFAAQLRPPKDYKQQQQQDPQQQQEGGSQPQQPLQQQQPSSQEAAAAAAGSSSSSTVRPEVQQLIESGQDKNSAAYRAAVRIQSRFRSLGSVCVCLGGGAVGTDMCLSSCSTG